MSTARRAPAPAMNYTSTRKARSLRARATVVRRRAGRDLRDLLAAGLCLAFLAYVLGSSLLAAIPIAAATQH